MSKEAQPEPESPSLEEHIPVDETARAQWTDFADKWRLDYLPAFSRWAAPTSTSDYLMWVFSRNMDALKAQGYMTKSYVETEIKAHFEVENLTHEGLAKTWNFDGETYTAVPGGVKDRPLARLDSCLLYTSVAQCCLFSKQGNNCGLYDILPPLRVCGILSRNEIH